MFSSTGDMPESLSSLKNILLKAIGDRRVKIYLFGSWSQNRNRNSSDIDIGIWHPASPGPEFFMNLRNLVEESTIPYRVDIVDLNHADSSFVEKVQEEGILWTD